MREICGKGLNRRCAIGKIHFYGRFEPTQTEKSKGKGDEILTELQRLEIAFRNIEETLYEGETSAFHDELLEKMRLAVFEGYEASAAVLIVSERSLGEEDDPYVSGGGAEICRICGELYRVLSKEGGSGASFPVGPSILVCEGISKQSLMAADASMILGIFLLGVPLLSDVAIYAHSLGVPLIVGENRSNFGLSEGEMAIIDSENGVLIASPDEETVEHYGLSICDLAINGSLDTAKNSIICFSDDYDQNMLSSALSELFDSASEGEIKILLPKNEEKQERVIAYALKASEKRRMILLLPSIPELSAVSALKFRLSELDEEAENISVGAVIDCGAAATMADEIAERTAFWAVDSDKLVSSLVFPEMPGANDEALFDIGCKAFLKISEELIEKAKKNGAKICFFGMIAAQKNITRELISLGADEVAAKTFYAGEEKEKIYTKKY